MRSFRGFAATCICATAPLVAPLSASAWGPDGHHLVGEMADKQIAGTHAATQVLALLGTLSLRDAAVWADCVKGISTSTFTYTDPPDKYPECKVYLTPEGEAEMADFARRNNTNCGNQEPTTACHAEYHYADVAIQRPGYKLRTVGTRDDDIVQATTAAIHVLRGDPAPAPFSIKNKREALLLLAHYVGDLHQPLHVGAIYLDASGAIVDPDKMTPYDVATETRGGNEILKIDVHTQMRCSQLHATWDALPLFLTDKNLTSSWLKQVKAVPKTGGDVLEWPARWGSGTVVAAQSAFAGLSFGAKAGKDWSVVLPDRYGPKMDSLKKQ